MPITEILSRNAFLYGEKISLVEINPELQEKHEVSWQEYELIEPNPAATFRRQMTWGEFEARANRFANLLLDRGVKKGDKVAILLMNCLEWLPLYFGILKAGAVAVPLNFRYDAEEIKYCLELAEVAALIFGPEFVDRIESIYEKVPQVKTHFYVGEKGPAFAENYSQIEASYSEKEPQIQLAADDEDVDQRGEGRPGQVAHEADLILQEVAAAGGDQHAEGHRYCAPITVPRKVAQKIERDGVSAGR